MCDESRERQVQIRASLARRRTTGAGSASGLESAGGGDEMPSPDDVLHRVQSLAARLPADELGDPAEFQKALDLVQRHGEPALRKLFDQVDVESDDELSALEAVVIADGSRPALFLKGGAADPDHPLAGQWRGDLSITRDLVRRVARSVGRIEPTNGSNKDYFGTCTVVDAGRGLVLTNHHVLQDVLDRGTTRSAPQGKGRHRIIDGAYVDFGAEKGEMAGDRFRVVEAQESNVDRLDAAVLKIETTKAGQVMPAAVAFTSDPSGPTDSLVSMCVVGHPGAPPKMAGTSSVDGSTIDWGWVHETLFGRIYGVKRVSPGGINVVLGRVSDEVDPEKWTFGHDATTLGGNSGSPVVAWKDGGAAFGLHFTGAVLKTNRAHAIGRCAARLREMGVPVVDP